MKYLNTQGWSDAHPHEVISISENGKSVMARSLDAKRTNVECDVHTSGGFSCHTEHPDGQKWEFSPNKSNPIEEWSLRKNGKFARKGYKNAGTARLSDQPYKYYDYNF